ncbi:MAG: hypothetical protein ABF289_01340 [Clostridiales bacterium]
MKKKLISIIFVLIVILQINIVYGNDLSENKTYFYEDIKIDNPTNGSVQSFFGDVEINSEFSGDIVIFFGDLEINSKVNGNVVSIYSNVKFSKKGILHGDIVNLGDIENSNKANIKGNQVNISTGKLPKINKDYFFKTKIYILAFVSIITLLFGLLFVWILSRWLKKVVINIEYEAPKKIAIGFLIYILLIIILMLTFYFIIPIILWFIIVIIINVLTMIFLGKIMMKSSSMEDNIYLEFILGYITVIMIRLIIILVLPYDSILAYLAVNMVFSLLINSFGLGIMIFGIKSKKTSI